MQGELLVEGESINTRMTFPSDDLVPGCYVRVIEAFNRWITDDIAPDIPGHNGLQMVRIVNAILESSREGNSELYIMDLDGSNLFRLTSHPAADITPTWDPRGRQIAFTSDRRGRQCRAAGPAAPRTRRRTGTGD